MSREAYIIDAVRTLIVRGKPDGWLHGIHPVDLLAMTLDEVTRRAGCPKEAVEDVVAGCVLRPAIRPATWAGWPR